LVTELILSILCLAIGSARAPADACRNNPFMATMKSSAGVRRNIGRGLTRIAPGQGTVIVFSARDGTFAVDGDGANSTFATALAQHLTDPNVVIGKLFRLVRDDVLGATGNSQDVFQGSSLSGKVFFFRLSGSKE
jgi:uncharacterized caspase-like protein